MAAILNRLNAAVDSLQQETAEFLQELVQAPSAHPPGDTRQAAEICRRKLQSFGLTGEIISPDGHNSSLIARLNPGGSPRLVFNSHLDTVSIGAPSAWNYPPLGGVIESGRLYGRGATDAKGCVAAMIMAAKALVLAGVELKGSLILNPVADEEIGGGQGAGHLLEQGLLEADLAVIGESTANRIGVAEKGMYWCEVTVFGKTAHGSTPWLGISAIDKTRAFLNLLEERVTLPLKAKSHPLTPPPTLNIGLIQGGVNTNVVADCCLVHLDRRILPGENLENAKGEIRAVLEELQERDAEFKYEIKTLAQGNAIETSPQDPLVRFSREACSELGLSDELVGFAQVTDGRFFHDAGLPTIILGPGNSACAHTPNEFIDLQQLYDGVKIYANIARKILA